MERLRHFPPGFPALNAVPIALGLSARQAARLIEASAFGVTVALVALAAGAAAGPWAAGLAGAMVLVTPAIVELHAMVLSEPVFLACLALMMFCMVRVPRRVGLLGVVAAAAALVRYAGVALVLAATLFALLLPGRTAERLRAAIVAALPGLLALGAWRFWAGPFRHYGYQSQASLDFGEAWQTVGDWLIPSLQPSAARSALALGALVCVVRTLWRRNPSSSARPEAGDGAARRQLLRASALVSACYIGVVMASKLYADPDIPFDWRLMSPLMLLTETCLAVAVVARWPTHAIGMRALGGALLAAWFLGSALSVTQLAERIHDQGLGYESADWQRSELAHWLRSDGARYALYSNDPTGIWHVSERSSRLLPFERDSRTLNRFKSAFARRRSALVAFADPLVESVPPAELADRLGLHRLATFDKATIWVE